MCAHDTYAPRMYGFQIDVRARMANGFPDLSPAARGVLCTLEYQAGLAAEPGVLPASERRLMSLAFVSSEEWAAVKDEIAARFDTTSRPGYWIMPWVVADHARQLKYMADRSRGGKRSGIARNRKQIELSSNSAATELEPCSCSSTETNTHLGTELIPETQTHTPQQTQTRALRRRREKVGAIRQGLVSELKLKHPDCDVDVVAAKVLAAFAEGHVRDVNAALRNWCITADHRGIDRKGEGRAGPRGNGRVHDDPYGEAAATWSIAKLCGEPGA